MVISEPQNMIASVWNTMMNIYRDSVAFVKLARGIVSFLQTNICVTKQKQGGDRIVGSWGVGDKVSPEKLTAGLGCEG